MLVKPELPDDEIIRCLQNNFGLENTTIQFLPLGADLNTAVYRVDDPAGQQYFLKLRSGQFAGYSVILPRLLHNQGINQIISPLSTCDGFLWARLEKYKVILYPFIEGKDGYEVDLTDTQLVEFGRTIKKIHSADIERQAIEQIPIESFSTKFSEQLHSILQRIQIVKNLDPVSTDLSEFLVSQENTIHTLISRTEQLSRILITMSLPLVVCHSDLHAGNLLIDTQGNLYIVDWDTLLRAPRERDLMYIGGGLGFRGHTLQEEVKLFYQGYGDVLIDQQALAYYRYARVVEDLVVECNIILSADQPGREDRERELVFLKSNFLPGNTIEIAFREDKLLFK